MPVVLKNGRVVTGVIETTQTTGTGTLDLDGAQTGYKAFVDELSDGQVVYYEITDDPDSPTEFEVGYGTFNTGSPNTLTRDTIEQSSNSGSKISLSAGTTYTVTGVLPAESLGTAAGKALKDSTAEIGVELIESGTVSSASELDITDLPSWARKIVISFDNLAPATDDVSFQLRVSTDNGSTFESGGSDYAWRAVSSATVANNQADSKIRIGLGITAQYGNAAGEVSAGDILIYNPGSASVKTTVTNISQAADTSGVIHPNHGAGQRATAQANDAVRLFFSSGNIASMNYTVYAFRNS